MQYYEIKGETNPKIIGRRYPQASGIVNHVNYDRNSPNSIFKANVWRKLDTALNIPSLSLHSQSKRTDFLSSVVNNQILLISEKLFELAKKFNLPCFQSFKTSVESKNNQFDYFFFFIPENSTELIDFEKSTFCIARWNSKIETIEINSFNEFKKEQSKYPKPNSFRVAVEQLVLNEKKIKYDFFRILGPLSSYFISESLRDAIIENGITGMEFISTSEMKIVH